MRIALALLLLLLSACGDPSSADDSDEVIMGTLNPPAGWTVLSGTWATDMDQSTSVVEDGAYSLHFKNTVPGADPKIESRKRQVTPGRSHQALGRVRADSIAGTSHVTIFMRWYDKDGVFISENSSQRVCDAINTWQWISDVWAAPSNAAFLSVALGKNNTAFNAYFAWADFREVGGAFQVFRTSGIGNQTSVNSGDTVIFNAAQHSWSDPDWSLNTSTGVITLKRGVWFVHGTIEIDGTDGQAVWSFLDVDGILFYPGTRIIPGASARVNVPVSAVIDASTGGQQLSLRARWTGGGTKTIYRTDADGIVSTTLAGHLITPP